jgi:hypothetical protein
MIVADSKSALKLRQLAARLLRDVGSDASAFVPLLVEFIAAGDSKVKDLWYTIRWMGYKRHHLSSREFKILHSVLQTGTPEQRYWVADQIAFFRCGKARRALIEVLDDGNVPAYVRAWAAERLQVAPITHETVSACLRAIKDPVPEIRLWCVSTLGVAAQYHPTFRAAVLPVIESMLSDDGEVPGWWPVRREASGWVASLRGRPEDEERLQGEIRAIRNDPGASKEDKFWAAGHDHSS